MTSTLYTNMSATTTQCQSSLPGLVGTIAQGAGGEPGAFATGMTQGIFLVPAAGSAPTSTCASGQVRAICNTSRPSIAATGCYFSAGDNFTNQWPIYGSNALRQDVAYIPLVDVYGNSTTNSSYATRTSDLVTGYYAGVGRMRIDIPQSLMDAAFNAADAQALTIISDTDYKPIIYTLGLGSAGDVADESAFQDFLKRVANDPGSSRYNASLPTGLFVYSPDDPQLAAAFRQIASQILRLSK
jgi:hypothetical protein